MKFRTQIPVVRNASSIDYNSNVLSMGSCFAVNMAEKFSHFKIRNTVNPFGILFHPLAIDEILHRCINSQPFDNDDIFEHNGLWQSFDVHSRMANSDPQTLLGELNEQLASTRELIAQASHIIITYGTAWAYREKTSRKIVANCHKMPAIHFEKEILSVDSIEAAIQNSLNLIQSINPSAHVILTISPVRHIKDGFVENQRSKSHLFAGLHQVLISESNSNASYFAAYEILIDELRDYRFYADDMIHPSALAVDYIWKRFTETYMAPETMAVMHEVDHIQKALAHRPINSQTQTHRDFTEKLRRQIELFTLKYPNINF